ncbi:amino acid ABC transporter substrate-binding protein [Zongyangia hominis]|uniref:Amino acid ABC transporter substrate-binding protein n=1 Tax=Zongyangia hominis TaxID=2763677 RepID=A0A926IB94_9FIRM|nr:amino acid ABC transporter substrate-binding protein [Zongyangia hominis]MBC8570048.1 amino acid ABC transporter substrate-binding protein [Zongyangia hominis]
MKKLLALLMALVLCATVFAGCAAKEESSSQSGSQSQSDSSSASTPAGGEKTDFIVGLDVSFPPMGFMSEDNEIVGFDIDMARAVAEKLGLELKLQPIEWSAKDMELNNGNIDCIWNGMTITEERQENMLLLRPYMANNQFIVVAKDSAIKTKSDLAGKIVAVQTDSSGEEALNDDPIKDEVAEVVSMADYVSALNDLKIGRIDAVVIDEVVARYYVEKEPDNFTIIEESLKKEQYAVGFKKGNTEFAQKVQDAFDELVEDGTAAEISSKWFGKDIVLK